MTSQDIPLLSVNENNGEDRATAAVLAGGSAYGVPAFVLRQWRTEDNSTAPVFVTWLPGVGRFCLTVKYGRYSLRDGDWYLDTRAGPGSTQSPLDQARLEALRVSETLRLRLGRSVPVAPALVFPDTKRDRRMERLASRDRVPLLWDLERYTARLAEAAAGPHFRQPLTERTALAEISALLERPALAGVGSSHPLSQGTRSAPVP